MFGKKSRKILAVGSALLVSGVAQADDSMNRLLPDAHFSGNLRVYDFSRSYAGNSLTNLHSFAVGGKIRAETPEVYGFSAGAGFYFAHDLGFNNYSQNNKYLNPLLMGTSRSIDVLGEAYLQYRTSSFVARAGNQSIDNPWINPSDGFMIPNLYQGVVAEYTPVDGLKLEAERILRFKNRTVSSFQASNLFELAYSNPRYNGTDNGSAALGATYKNESASGKAWLYNFYDFAKMAYLEGGYRLASLPLSPFVNIQYMRETGSGAQFLGAVDSTVYGAKIGLDLPGKLGNAFIAYDKVPYKPAAGISNGNLLSPYTQVYNTDPLYTTVMNYGLVSARAAGHAMLLGATIRPLGKTLEIVPTLSRYNTAPFVADVNAFMLDVSYHLQSVKGLTLRNRLGIEHGNPLWGNRYVDERIMLQYSF